MEAAAVEGNDAGGFLPAMLQGVQAEGRDGGGVRMSENSEHAAFLAQPVTIEIEVAEIEVVSSGAGSGVFWRVDHLVHRVSGSHRHALVL